MHYSPNSRISVYLNTHSVNSYNNLSDQCHDSELSVSQLLTSSLEQPITYEIAAKEFEYATPQFMPKEACSKPKIVWLDIVDPSNEEILALGQLLELHQLTLEDLFESDRSADRFNYFTKYLYIELQNINLNKSVENEKIYDKYCNSTFFILKSNVLVTIRGLGNISYRDDLISIFKDTPFNSTTILSPEYICFLLLNSITQDFQKAVNAAQLELDSIEDLLTSYSREDQDVFFKKISVIGSTITSLIRKLRMKPTITKKLLREFKGRLLSNLSINHKLFKNQPPNSHPETLQLPLILNFYLDIKNSVYGLRSLHDDTEHMIVRCNRFNHVLTDSYNYYLSSLLLSSDRKRLKSLRMLQQWSQIFGLSSLSSIFYQIAGINVSTPFGINQEFGEKNQKYNKHYVPFIVILVVSAIIPIYVYFGFARTKKLDY